MTDHRINKPAERPGMVVYGYYRFPTDPPGQVRYLYRKKTRADRASVQR